MLSYSGRPGLLERRLHFTSGRGRNRPTHERECQFRAVAPFIYGTFEKGSAKAREGAPTPASRTDYLRQFQKPGRPERERERQVRALRAIIYGSLSTVAFASVVNNRSGRVQLALPLAFWGGRLLQVP